MAGEEQTVSAEAVRAELRRVLGSANFDAAAAALGLAEEAPDAVATILSLDPDYPANVAADLESRSIAPELIGSIVASLAKAGLPASRVSPARAPLRSDVRH